MQHCGPRVNDIGEVNVAFVKTDSSMDIRINSTQALNDEEKDEGNEENDSLTPQDMMSFSWQIAKGMASYKRFVPFNYLV